MHMLQTRIAAVELDEHGRVVLSDPDLSEIENNAEVRTAGGDDPPSNHGCEGGTNQDCTNTVCTDTTNVGNCMNTMACIFNGLPCKEPNNFGC